CGSQNAISSNRSILHSQRGQLFKLPKISLSGALNAIDSALSDMRILPTILGSSRSNALSFPPASPIKVGKHLIVF
ncbi:unnamed protein product, partial [Onchocerca ochengi]